MGGWYEGGYDDDDEQWDYLFFCVFLSLRIFKITN